MSEFIDVPVKAETTKVKEALTTFLDNHKETIAGQLNSIMSMDGTQTDAQIKIENGGVTIYQLAPDKGFVLGEQEGDLPIQLVAYKDIPVGNRYVNQEKELTVLYIKKEEGKADVRLGMFKSINDAIAQFNSDDVKKVITQYNEREAALAKAEAKTERRLQKLGKLPTEEAQVESTDAE